MDWGTSLAAKFPSNEQGDMGDQASQHHEDDLPADTERALVAQLRDGDPEAFATVVARYANRLVRFASHVVGSQDSAEDVVQQVFVWLWENRETLHSACHLKSYLFRAVRNGALNASNAESVRDRYRTSIQESAAAGSFSSFVPSPEGTILTSATFQSAIEQLSERRQLAVRLRLQEEMTHSEIADVLGVSPLAAQLLVSRAITELRKILWDE